MDSRLRGNDEVFDEHLSSYEPYNVKDRPFSKRRHTKKACTSNMNSRELYLRLLRHVLPYWKFFLISILAMVVMAATEPALPALLKPMLDGSFVKKDPTTIRWVPLLLVGLFLVRGVASYITSYAMSWLANQLIADLRNLMFRRLVAMPTRFYDNTSSGTVIANIAYNVNQVAAAGTSAIKVLITDTLTIVGLLAWMLYLDWKLTLIFLTVTPAIVFLVKIFSGRLREMSRGAQNSLGDITHILEESLDGHKVVKVFGGQDYECRRFFDATNQLRRYGIKLSMASAANVPIIQVLMACALAIIVYMASSQTETTVGGFVSFLTAMLMLLPPIKRLTGVNETLQKGLAAAEVVFELLDSEPEQDKGSHHLPRAQGELELRHVCFRYIPEGSFVLDDVSLHIKQGETVALVGASGSGKTTLANLVPRFYAPTSGQIFVDGHDIHDVRLSDLRANIALVSQDVVLFNDTVYANIAYGINAATTEAEVIAATEAAHAMEFIREMPQGLQTMVGENGVRLSGGQRQRIAIARALLKNAPILILDEATSALDTQSERHVQEALETLMQGRTTLVIAHRLSTIDNADRIVVMQKGRIVEMGRHAELLEKGGIYANLHRIQFSDEEARRL